MGIRLKATTQKTNNTLSLTEYSIKNIIFNSDKNIKLNPKINDITNSIIIEGIINFESVHLPPIPKQDSFGRHILDEYDEPMYEEREIDSVRQLANWAIIPEYLNCYCDVETDITDATGSLVKKLSYKNMFAVDYKEIFDDEYGHGKFFITLIEREYKPKQGTHIKYRAFAIRKQ